MARASARPISPVTRHPASFPRDFGQGSSSRLVPVCPQKPDFPRPLQMDIDTPTLKSCGLGKIIIFYTKSRRSTLRVKRLAERLQLNWLRPLVKSSSSYRTKKVVEVDIRDRKPLPRFKSLQDESKRSKREESLTPGGEKSEIKAQSIGNKRRGARIPMSSVRPFPSCIPCHQSRTDFVTRRRFCRAYPSRSLPGSTPLSHPSRRRVAGTRTRSSRTWPRGSGIRRGCGRSRTDSTRRGGQRRRETDLFDAFVLACLFPISTSAVASSGLRKRELV